MARRFGTDGIRGIAGKELTMDLALRLGRAAGHVLGDGGGKVLIGRDTRASGEALENALAAGFQSVGYDVERLGVVPTPAVAYLTSRSDAVAGCVISASHNPYNYNGIKIFSSEGFKLPDEVEDAIEELLDAEVEEGPRFGTELPSHGVEDYIAHLLSDCADLSGLTVAIDCANGALSGIAHRVLAEAGAEVIASHEDPDGENINANCGSTHPEVIRDLVLATGADAGLSFDGDADRVIAVDEKGNLFDGDHILAALAQGMKRKGQLAGNALVGTVMTNIGLDRYLEDLGVGLVKAKVGDRYVLEEMKKGGFVLGGEQSGHIIALEKNTTGDGLATGLMLLSLAVEEKRPLSELNELMVSYPQVLVNAKVKTENKHNYMEVASIAEAISQIEERFQGEGRVLIRPSGTEPLVRVMIEGKDQEVLTQEANALAALIEEHLGG